MQYVDGLICRMIRNGPIKRHVVTLRIHQVRDKVQSNVGPRLQEAGGELTACPGLSTGYTCVHKLLYILAE